MTRPRVVVLAMLGLGLPAMAHAQSVRAQLEDAQAKVVGTATLSEVPGGVRVTLRVNGLKPGEHGFTFTRSGSASPSPMSGLWFQPWRYAAKKSLRRGSGRRLAAKCSSSRTRTLPS